MIAGYGSGGNKCLVCLCAIRQQVAESAHRLPTRDGERRWTEVEAEGVSDGGGRRSPNLRLNMSRKYPDKSEQATSEAMCVSLPYVHQRLAKRLCVCV